MARRWLIRFWTGYWLARRSSSSPRCLLVIVPLLRGRRLLTYAERKVLASIAAARAPTWSARSACCSPSPTA